MIRSIVICLLLCSCAHIDKHDAAWLVMHTIDVGQTITTSRHNPQDVLGDGCTLKESHFITRAVIGRHPDTDHVYKWGVGMVALKFGINYLFERFDIDSTVFKISQNSFKFGVAATNHERDIYAWDQSFNGCDK